MHFSLVLTLHKIAWYEISPRNQQNQNQFQIILIQFHWKISTF